ncbi:MAG: nucleotidyltransferase domain-containing protein [Candidatus Kerfeldbacteria bacterium]|nr:nucleotidyltransferase domain-containing protein [Candidatus Kerfeldbacteria bacterium]
MFTLNQQVREQLASLGVLALYFFGSRAYGLATTRSDFDFGVLLRDPLAVTQTSLELYQPIYNILSSLIHPETLAADVIDIVFLDSPRVPLELKFHIISHGQVMYDIDPQQRIIREENFMIQHADFAPLRVQMRQALLARL